MNFADVNAGVIDLRHAVNTQVQSNAFREIGTRGPAGAEDEAGFLRLVAWSYAFLFERGRIIVPFLLQVPDQDTTKMEEHQTTRKHVQMLRTWLFHSLDADSERDLEIGKSASQWFLSRCGTTSPQKPADWQQAFSALCAQVTSFAVHCTGLVSKIARDPESAELQFGVLRLRLNRDWQAFQFDQIVEDAATRLGQKIDVKAFRARRLSEWRKFLAALPEDADLKVEMQRVIDSEVFAHFRSRLPVSSDELMQAFALPPGTDVLFALEMARYLSSLSVISKDSLMKQLSTALHKSEES